MPTHPPARELRSLLVPVDLTPASDRVLGRAPLLRLADDAHLTLLHVVPERLSDRDQEHAREDANRYLAAEAQRLGGLLGERVRVETQVVVGSPAQQIATHVAVVRDWVENNPQNTEANTALIYAWNELTEGGWLS